ncbi:MAG: MoaD/ThiS family protein [Candidatus Asgardarchaeia archaeon]
MVKVKFLAQLRQDLGTQERELDINNITIIELLKMLTEEYNKPFLKLIEDDLLVVMHNSRVLDREELENVVIDSNDIITLMPPIVGGAL